MYKTREVFIFTRYLTLGVLLLDPVVPIVGYTYAAGFGASVSISDSFM